MRPSAVKSPTDGYTLLFSAMAAMAINPHLYPNIGYDVRQDFASIINVAYPNSILAALRQSVALSRVRATHDLHEARRWATRAVIIDALKSSCRN